MGGIAVGGAGGCSDHRLVIVTGSGDDLAVLITAIAVVGDGAVGGAGGFHNSGVVIVTQRICVIVNIAVAAVIAGVGCETALSTGGIGDNTSILVTGGRNGFLVGVTAVGTCVYLAAVFGAGCAGFNTVIIVSQCLDHFNGALAAAGAGGGDGAVFGAGCVYSYGFKGVFMGIDYKVVRILFCQTCNEVHHIALVGLVVGVGLIAPNAVHGAGKIGQCHGRAVGNLGNRGVVDTVVGIVITVAFAGSADNIIPVVVGVENFVSLGNQVCRGCYIVSAPGRNPVCNDNVRIKGGVIVLVEVNAVVESDGLHAGIFDDSSYIINVFDIIIVPAVALHIAEAHGTAGVDIGGILVSANVEVLRASGSKVIHILLHQSLCECNGGGIGQRNGGGGSLGGSGAPPTAADFCAVSGRGNTHIFSSVQNGAHVSGRIDQRDDADSLGSCIAYDGVHLALRPFTGMGKADVTGLNAGGNLITGIGGGAYGDGHIVQKQTQTAVADCQLHVCIAGCCQGIDDFLDLADSKVLTAYIQMEYTDKIFMGSCCRCVDRQNECQHQSQCEE